MALTFISGTQVPDDLILVHEGPGREEWSLQPAREMALDGKPSLAKPSYDLP